MGYHKFFFLALLIGVSFAFYYIIYPFFLVVVFALIFAHFFKKPYRYFEKRFNERFASVISVLLVVVVIVIPFLLFTILLSIEAKRGYGHVQVIIAQGLEEMQSTLERNLLYQNLRDDPKLVNTLSGLFLDQQAEKVEDLLALVTSSIKNFIGVVFKNIQGILVNVTSLVFSFLLMLYLLYFFFKEGDNVLQQIKNFVPMKEEETEELIDEGFKIIDATFIGTLIIGVLEGTYGGLLFYFLDVPSPVTWGMMMVVLSMLPVVGTNGLLIPLGVYQIAVGNYWGGLIVLVVGCGGIMISQNIIKPKLVGDRSGLHPTLIVLSTIGGIYTFGISGFLIGPIIATIFVVFWRLFRQKISIDSQELTS